MNILLSGVNGRMGKEVIEALGKQNDMLITCGFDRIENNKEKFLFIIK